MSPQKINFGEVKVLKEIDSKLVLSNPTAIDISFFLSVAREQGKDIPIERGLYLAQLSP